MKKLHGLLKLKKNNRKYKNKKKLLSRRRPLRRAVVTAAVLRSPKKPHSSKRATVKFIIQKNRKLKNYAYILGEGGRRRLKKYDVIYFRGGRRRDIPAMKYTAVYGVTTKTGKSGSLPGLTYQRKKGRSKYGAKSLKTYSTSKSGSTVSSPATSIE